MRQASIDTRSSLHNARQRLPSAPSFPEVTARGSSGLSSVRFLINYRPGPGPTKFRMNPSQLQLLVKSSIIQVPCTENLNLNLNTMYRYTRPVLDDRRPSASESDQFEHPGAGPGPSQCLAVARTRSVSNHHRGLIILIPGSHRGFRALDISLSIPRRQLPDSATVPVTAPCDSTLMASDFAEPE